MLFVLILNIVLISPLWAGDPLLSLPKFQKGVEDLLKGPALKFCSVPKMEDKSYSFPLYKRPQVKGTPYAIFCWHASKKLLRVGHSTTTIFLIDKDKSSEKQLFSKERISISSWPVKNKVEWKGKIENTYLHFNGSADYVGHFVDKDQEEAETLCVPITKAEAADLVKYLENVKGERWTLSENCNDFSRNMFSVIGINIATDKGSSKGICDTDPMKNKISMAKYVMESMVKAKQTLELDQQTRFDFNLSELK